MNLVLEMILKDEAESLPRTLNCLTPLLDPASPLRLTGAVLGLDPASTDATEDIARKWCERVGEPECFQVFDLGEDAISQGKSFARARNAVNNKTRELFCEADSPADVWALILDGHEHFEVCALALLQRIPDTLAFVANRDDFDTTMVETISIRVRMADEETKTKWAPQPRIHKIDEWCSWSRDIHNILNCTLEGAEHVVFETIELLHDRPESNMLKRSEERGEAVPDHCRQRLEEDPNDRHANYYLGTWHESREQWAKAIKHYKRCLKRRFDLDQEYRASLMTRVGYCTRLSDGKERDAQSWLLSAIKTCPWMAEPWIELGIMAKERGEFLRAETYFDMATHQQRKPTNVFLDDRNYTYMPWVHLADTYHEAKNWKAAIAAGMKALEFNPPDRVGMALGGGINYWQQQFKREDAMPRPDDGKPCLAIFDHVSQFAIPIAQYFADSGWNVVRPSNGRFHPKVAEWADVSLCYFANENAIHASSERLPGALIVMACGYEQYGPSLSQIDWKNVDYGLFRSDQIRRTAMPYLRDQCPTKVILDGVDARAFNCRRFKLPNWQAGEHLDIGMVALLSQKKGLPLLLQLMSYMKGAGVDYTIHVRGVWQDPMQKSYFEHGLTTMGLWGNIEFEPWQDTMSDEEKSGWYQDKHVVLSTSMIETFQLTLAEGMACGLWPLVHHWKGAEALWPAEMIWRTPAEALVKLDEASGVDNRQWRRYIVGERKLTRDRELKELARVVKAAMRAHPREVIDDAEDTPGLAQVTHA